MLLGGIAAVLFAIVFLSGKRAGIPIAGLIMGSVLAESWSSKIIPSIEAFYPVLFGAPISVIVPVVLVLIPAFLMIGAAPKNHSSLEKLFSSVVFSLVAAVILVAPLGDMAILASTDKVLYDMIILYKSTIISLGVLVAMIDITIGHFKKHKPAGDKKHH